jgi:hypothetical protein
MFFSSQPALRATLYSELASLPPGCNFFHDPSLQGKNAISEPAIDQPLCGQPFDFAKLGFGSEADKVFG